MWFASIWVFTLRLPWELGADFFVRHLIDGDPASNTLGWRWVAGLHTAGKSYLATPTNIRTCAEERLAGRSDQALGLNRLASTTFTVAERLPAKALQRTEIPWPAPAEKGFSKYRCNHGRTTMLVTEEDITWLPSAAPEGVIVLSPSPRSGLEASSGLVERFVTSALDDARQRIAHHWAQAPVLTAPHTLGDEALVDWLVEHRMDEVLCAYLPVGPTRIRVEGLRERLACRGINLRMQMRDYDRFVWPHASKGFFQLGKRIPEFLDVMRLYEKA
jgi:deoxyribodipyrimidine photo-lyase